MIDLLLHDLIPSVQFGVVWNLMDEMETAGTTHCPELASNEYYTKAVADWVKYKETRRQVFAKSKSM